MVEAVLGIRDEIIVVRGHWEEMIAMQILS
jgi:hypothetical protein